MLHIHWNGSGNEVFAVVVNMPVVPEFGWGSKRFGGCCYAGLDVVVVLKAVGYVGSKVLEVLGVCHESAFHIDQLCFINSVEACCLTKYAAAKSKQTVEMKEFVQPWETCPGCHLILPE